MIAHRLSTIKKADDIVVMGPGGKILEQGAYEKLLALKGAFSDLIRGQEIAQNVNEMPEQRQSFDEKSAMVSSLEKEVIAEKTTALQKVTTSSSREDEVRATTPSLRSKDSGAEISPWSLIKFVASLNRAEWKSMLVGIIASILAGAGEPVQCVILAKTIATLSLPPAQNQQMRSQIQLWSGIFVMIAVVVLACFFVLGIALAHCSERLIHRCRQLAFRSMFCT